MIIKLLTEHHLEFGSLKGGCRVSSESTHVKIPHCWKSHAIAHIFFFYFVQAIVLGLKRTKLRSPGAWSVSNTSFKTKLR